MLVAGDRAESSLPPCEGPSSGSDANGADETRSSRLDFLPAVPEAAGVLGVFALLAHLLPTCRVVPSGASVDAEVLWEGSTTAAEDDWSDDMTQA